MMTRRMTMVTLALSALATPLGAQATALAGRWLRHENGVLAETLDIRISGASVEIAYFLPNGSPNGVIHGTLGNDLLIARSPRRLVFMVPREGRLIYASTDHDGSNRWDGEFHR